MLTPRFSIPRPLAFCLWLGSIAALGIWGCQGPDTFLRKTDGGAIGGKGSGGSSFGAGGHLGAGGSAGGSFGSGGAFGSGGSGAGGRIGSGGSSAGGSLGAGGMTGTGGARDGGTDATGAGGGVVDANPDSEGGPVSNGMGPCMGICAPATEFVSNKNFMSPTFLTTVAICYETTSPLQGGGCSNCDDRTISINGSTPNGVWPASLPAAVRGGFCIQVSAALPDGGAHDYADFYTFAF